MADYFLGPKPNSYDGAYLLVDRLADVPIAGKLLVVSSRSPQHDQVLASLAAGRTTPRSSCSTWMRSSARRS